MATATATIKFTGFGQVTIHREDHETLEDLLALKGPDLFDRMVNIGDLIDNCVEDDDLELDDISLDT